MRTARVSRYGRLLSGLSLPLLALFAAVGVFVDADSSPERTWDTPVLYGLIVASIVTGAAGMVISIVSAVRAKDGRGRAMRWALLGAIVPFGLLALWIAVQIDPGVDFAA